MAEIFFVSDHHFGHANIISFISEDGKTRVRPEFHTEDGTPKGIRDVELMDRTLIERHNSVVGPNDKVYFLGDVAFDEKTFHRVMPQLNGHKRLILGNHDDFVMDAYLKYFRIEPCWRQFGREGFVCTHVPIHEQGLTAQYFVNVHGHIHRSAVRVTLPPVRQVIEDPRYFNVSVEALPDYTPVPMDVIIDRVNECKKRFDPLGKRQRQYAPIVKS